MTLIIDGHNLIPHIPGMQLSDLDDETQLIHYIQEYCRRKRVKAELFFDGSPAGAKPSTGGGLVHVHFVRKSSTADRAMIEALNRQGRNTRNFNLVSSDRQVQTEARALGCSVLSSDQFAAELLNTLSQVEIYSKDKDTTLSTDEVEDWLNVFKGKDKSD
jgi:predicted RNA-binding protein with PIN domain